LYLQTFMDLKSTCDSKMHYIVFTTTIKDNFGIHDFYPVLPMGKNYPFTHFHPVLPNRFYPVGKTYHANPANRRTLGRVHVPPTKVFHGSW